MKDATITCRRCGQRVAVITWGIYRKSIVDPECLMVEPDPDGEDFVRVDGSKIRGRERKSLLGDAPAEPAYRMHRKTCGGRG